MGYGGSHEPRQIAVWTRRKTLGEGFRRCRFAECERFGTQRHAHLPVRRLDKSIITAGSGWIDDFASAQYNRSL
jgi:hypothetical protein